MVRVSGQDGCPPLADICRSLSLASEDQALSAAADEHKLDVLRAHLARNKTVIVVDDVRRGDSPESRALRELARTVPRGSLMIISANGPATVEGARLSLEDLDPPDARKLVRRKVERGELRHPAAREPDFADRVLELVGGNPRMIELFLGLVDRSPRPLDEVCRSVEQGKGFEGLLDPLWAELMTESRMALGVCAHLGGTAIPEQVEVATGAAGDELWSALEDLVALGLVTRAPLSSEVDAFTCGHAIRRFALGSGGCSW